MDNPNSTSAAVVVDKYLPELDSPEIREQVVRAIEAVPGRVPQAVESDFPPPPAYDPDVDSDGRLLDYFRHWVRLWSDALTAEVDASSQVAPDATIAADFVFDQVEQAASRMMRVLLEELYQRRSRGLLEGDDPAERYRSFRRWTNSPEGHRELLARYPHLFETARERVQSAARYLVRILHEIEVNRPVLDERMPGAQKGSLVRSVNLGKGDTHNGGKTVALIEFDDGNRILYKPRPVDAERGYSSFVSWLNDRLGTQMRTIVFVPCGDGGFSEYVPTGGFAGTTGDYFRRIGQLTGVLYLVKATDIHFENVLTCPEGPVVIDAETLLTPRWRTTQAEEQSAWATAVRRVRESVAGIGVLPMVLRSPGTDQGMDIGVVGYDTGQAVPYRALQFTNPGRDDMSAKLVAAETSDAAGNPSVRQTADLPPAEQRDTIKQELRRVLEFAAQNPAEVADAIQERLGGAQFRYMNNGTMFYAQLLRMATHPDAITDPRVRAAVLHRVVLHTGALDEVAREEVRQLNQGDVPYFTYTGDSTAMGGQGRTVRPESFAQSAVDTVRARITGLDQAEIDWQLRLVDLAFVSRLPLAHEVTGFAPGGPGDQQVRIERSRLLLEATRIGDELAESMVEGTDPDYPATWVAPQIATYEDLQWSPGVLGYDLYSGTPGIALVLAGLARETGRTDYRDAALRVLDPVEHQLFEGTFTEARLSPGAMSGAAGTVYGLATARRLLGAEGGMGPGGLAQALTTWMDTAVEPDLASGTAGALAVCLAIHRHTPDGEQRALVADAAHRAADALMRLLTQTEDEGRVTDYTGYAHGPMGIAPFLLEYADVFADDSARELARRLVGAVVRAYDEQARDWPRTWHEGGRSYAWCHGAPGMLLGALEITRRAPEAIPGHQLARMAELTLGRGFGNNPSYCHGDLGNTEIVLLAARQRPDLFPAHVPRGLYERLFDSVVESYGQRWDTKYAYSSSLMLGRAGMAWSVLRHLDPDTYPSVLRFD